MKTPQPLHNRHGLTLIELIVVMLILVVLAAILVPQLGGYISRAADQAAKTECRAAVQAAEVIYSEALAQGIYYQGVAAPEEITTKITSLAQLSGTVSAQIETDEKNSIYHLSYQTANERWVTFCRAYQSCDEPGHNALYNMVEGGSVKPANTPYHFYLTTEDGRLVKMSPYGNYSQTVPTKHYSLSGTYWYYEGDDTFPAGYYAFKFTSPLHPNLYGEAGMQQIHAWNNLSRINTEKPIKTYVPKDAAFLSQLRGGDVCEIERDGQKVLAVYSGGTGTNYGDPAPMWLRDRDFSDSDNYWIVLDETSKPPTQRN